MSPRSPSQPRSPQRALSRATLRRRRTRSRPEHGWGLVDKAAERLGIGAALQAHLACRAFSVALHRLLPRLEPQARAEQLATGTLTVRVSSSAVASELVYVKDMLLDQVNLQLRQLASAMAVVEEAGSGPARPRRRPSRPVAAVERLVFRVGPVKALPAYSDWTQFVPRAPEPVPPHVPWDLAVASEVAHVKDRELREALLAMYRAVSTPDKRRPVG
jgi:hypothetical protein